ncbi:MAG: TrkA family potassium uptake protein [bacterium]
MKRSYAVLGISTFSQRAATSLHALGATVLAIDLDESLVQEICNNVTRAVCADVRHRDVLRNLGVLDCDVVILGLRHHFDITVLTVRFLAQNHVPTIVAQVDSLDELEAIRAVGATHAVFPERDAADRLVKELALPGFMDKITLAKDIGLAEIPCPKSFADKSILELNIRRNHRVTIIGIKSPTETGEETRITPPPETKLHQRDTLVVIGKLSDVAAFADTYSAGDRTQAADDSA